jgi:predicted RNA-binding Zn-ribbon protein involved in translation (DUF1610 family)
MSGNEERISLDIKCPNCGNEDNYFTLINNNRMAIAYVYPKHPEKTKFSSRMLRTSNPWEMAKKADAVFCPKCGNYLFGKYVAIIKIILTRHIKTLR